MNRKNIIDKKPIDLRHPHLTPRRIKQYALDIFDTVQKYQVVAPEVQQLHLLLLRAEEILQQDAMESEYFAKTRTDNLHLKGLKALINGEQEWYIERKSGLYDHRDNLQHYIFFPYPFFLTYYIDNNLTSPIGAVCEIIGVEKNQYSRYEFSLEQLSRENPKNRLPSQGAYSGEYLHYPSRWEWSNAIADSKRFQLFNFDLLQDYEDQYSLRPAFVVENFQAANELESAIKEGEIQYHLAALQYAGNLNNTKEKLFIEYNSRIQIYKNHNGISVVDRGMGTSQPRNLSADDCFTMFMETIRYTDSTPAAGDAVVTAPVGGYNFPAYSDWSLLRNRDIYIFKFGECHQKKCLEELLAVTECIVRDTDNDIAPRIKYVIMREKCGLDVENNDIKYWGMEELFAEAQIHDCLIPSELEENFDLYCRKNSPTRTNPYVIEPFLRRHSWMLLSGEEGTGKSFMAMALGTAIAAGGKLFLDWKIRQRKAKVMYIADSEMTDDIIRERMEIFKKLNKGCTDNFIIESVRNLNLLTGGMDYIEMRLQKANVSGSCVEVLILDHLLKLTCAKGDEEEHWPRIREWIEQLNERGITVILLHHEYAGQRMLGTRLIAADAPSRIHLEVVEQPQGEMVKFGVAVVKNRGGKLNREAIPVTLQLGKHPRWMLTGGEETESEKISFRKMSFEERKNKVIEFRKQEMTNLEIARAMNCSQSSVEKIISKLPDEYKRIIKK
ncbi:MAG: hypothetical protein E7039_11000 [Lentisphaerae bacterium]|nr:hypothetical protein [Lentisphaerota bacterium]